ncbi:transcription factor TFIIIB, SANT domain, putative [Perkinsus marinus ATCC 50983]|uniref:Transcription factor TFIIIB, SANT domain, putative n=1 Tax=Perkinsus marinus (strain ATCC 50983 / TXsc) TaxID=423536 RepID=C5KGP8_PERM5|nr:transcription factor TFIIIB, SANT domain, putative [Perkinsus marinus ATCC 50983]EER16316.1 transcription factor TFIIIB, SANT domain, putative [Perkinsus marinus ATCC 50983]|eukprot:XP_002784520.1 transcription factor TFIIIB, SANT domain, putative [Perkinsus marinus ATCC 50983]
MTQLLREDTPQASAILTTGLSTITSRSKQQHQSNKNEEQQQHTTNIGDIIKSAGATTLDEVVDDNSDDENDDDGDMAGLLPYIDNNIGSSTQVDRSRGNTTTSNLPQLRFDESGNIVLVDDEGAGNRGQEDNTNNTIGDNSLRLMHTRDESGQNNYKYAYKKSIGGKWSKDDTNLFYKGIEMYGPDLMLISTVFGSTKTPAQLRQKLKVEGKRNPNRLNKALESRKTISLQEFEKAHGPIDGIDDDNGGGRGRGGVAGFDYQADLVRILDGID